MVDLGLALVLAVCCPSGRYAREDVEDPQHGARGLHVPDDQAGQPCEGQGTLDGEVVLSLVAVALLDQLEEPEARDDHVHDAAGADVEDEVANLPAELVVEHAPDDEDRRGGVWHEPSTRADGCGEASSDSRLVLFGHTIFDEVREEDGRRGLAGERGEQGAEDYREACAEGVLEERHDRLDVLHSQVRGAHDPV